MEIKRGACCLLSLKHSLQAAKRVQQPTYFVPYGCRQEQLARLALPGTLHVRYAYVVISSWPGRRDLISCHESTLVVLQKNVKKYLKKEKDRFHLFLKSQPLAYMYLYMLNYSWFDPD